MIKRPILLALVIALSAPAAWSRDVNYDFVVCTHGTQNVLEAGPNLTALGVESWGVVATSTTPEWEKATTRCVGYLRIMAGKVAGKGLCKWFNMAGDTALGEWEISDTGENTWKWLTGTGGLQGIKSVKSTWSSLGNGKPAAPGTSQGCRRDQGTYSLP